MLSVTLLSFAMAGPVQTVPWNGYVGAVSFTFDDALKNQIDNLKPILEELSGVKVTFFVTNMSNGLQGNAAGFAALANAGHEIGNHTQSHGHMTGQSESELNGKVNMPPVSLARVSKGSLVLLSRPIV